MGNEILMENSRMNGDRVSGSGGGGSEPHKSFAGVVIAGITVLAAIATISAGWTTYQERQRLLGLENDKIHQSVYVVKYSDDTITMTAGPDALVPISVSVTPHFDISGTFQSFKDAEGQPSEPFSNFTRSTNGQPTVLTISGIHEAVCNRVQENDERCDTYQILEYIVEYRFHRSTEPVREFVPRDLLHSSQSSLLPQRQLVNYRRAQLGP